MQQAQTGRTLNSVRAREPGPEVEGPDRAARIRPVQISVMEEENILWNKQKIFCEENRKYFVRKTESILWGKQKIFCEENRKYFVRKKENILLGKQKIFC